MTQIQQKIAHLISQEINAKPQQIIAAIELLDGGATVPFISRYRKEVTGGLDDTQMRTLEDRLRYLRELEERRESILKSISEQDKLSPELEVEIRNAETKNRLEDLYLPHKPKRRTKGQIAIEAGLQPLAVALLANPCLIPEQEAQSYINKENAITETKAALDGAKYILMEHFSENADLLTQLRLFLWQEGTLSSRLVKGKEQEGSKFRDYFEFDEAINKVPSHRALAMFRGRNEAMLSLSIEVGNQEDKTITHPCEVMVAKHWQIDFQDRPADKWLKEVVRWTWRIKLYTHIETDLMAKLRESAEEEAIKVFASNLKDLLLSAPAGPKATIGLDPGLRTGVKVAVVDGNGKVLDHAAIYPTPPQNKIEEASATLIKMAKQYQVELIAIGNGTASRETDRFVGDIISAHPELKLKKVIVNESGASIYSASEYAAKEYPDLDVTIRGAISIAHRLQDPLAELVKIEPKAIGVGQYQHDVSQTQMARALDAVVEDCVNSVGVDVNTASSALLNKVSGLNHSLANNIVEFRDQHGSFKNREQLKKIKRFGDKTFEQAAGFLRIMNGDNPLDVSAVHPETYAVVEKIVAHSNKKINDIMGNSQFLKSLDARQFIDENVGIPTVTDILQELDKPGRDPRPEFKTAEFKDGIEKISDLKPDMILEGTVTNVTNFGAFIDIGVHQDGLVHISALANSFVKDPRSIVKAGDIVKVKVLEIDKQRKRIALTMRLTDKAEANQQQEKTHQAPNKPKKSRHINSTSPAKTGTFAQLFAEAKIVKAKT
jgi:uncharacterized protein